MKKTIWGIAIILVMCVGNIAKAQPATQPTTQPSDRDLKISYALGIIISEEISQEQFKLDIDSLRQGFLDSQNKTASMSYEEAQEYIKQQLQPAEPATKAKPKSQCTDCKAEFEVDPAVAMKARGKALDCKKCGAKKAAVPMTMCPECKKHFVSEFTKMQFEASKTGVQPDLSKMPEIVCPHCGINLRQWAQEQREIRRAQYTQKKCLSNLNSIGKAMTLYRVEHDDKMPQDFDVLIKDGMIGEEHLRCPLAPIVIRRSYIYRGSDLSENASGSMIALHDAPNLPHGDKISVLLYNGSVESLTKAEFDPAIAEDNAKRKELGLVQK